MKKVRKLRIKEGQELSALAQDLVLAGGSGWSGTCRCQKVGSTHVETMTVTVSNPNWGDMASGLGYMILGGAATYFSNGFMLPVTGPVIGLGFESFYNGMTNQTSVTYHRLMELESTKPRRHSVKKTWTT